MIAGRIVYSSGRISRPQGEFSCKLFFKNTLAKITHVCDSNHMEIYNTTTNAIINLTYYDRSIDVAQQQDTAEEFVARDPDVVYNQEEDRYEASQETIDYWEAWLDKTMQGDELEREVREMLKQADETDVSERIHYEIDQHYTDDDVWPQQRIVLLEEFKSQIECE